MRQRLMQIFQVPEDLDYVQSFAHLAQVNLELRRRGPSPERLVRKARLEREVGNYAAGLTATQEALALDPHNPEMHYHVGIAFLYLALAKASALPVGPTPTDLPNESPTDLLAKSVAAFQTVLGLNPGDEDARQDALALQAALDAHPNDGDLVDALRARRV
jgi:tetratricopeptide (TPR) repeat protein